MDTRQIRNVKDILKGLSDDLYSTYNDVETLLDDLISEIEQKDEENED